MTDTAAPARARSRRLELAILVATAGMTFAVAGVCIYLSYHGLYELALDQGPKGFRPMAPLWPIVPDGLLIIGSASVLSDEVTGHDDEIWKGWTMVAAGTLLSIAAQASMAGEPSLGPLVVAGSPPLVLAIAWAYLMRMVRRAVRPARRPRTLGRDRAARPDRAQPGRTAAAARGGHGREVDARADGNGDGSPNPVGVGGVRAAGDATGRPDGQLPDGDAAPVRTLAGQADGRGGRSDPGSGREERWARAWQVMADDLSADRRTTGSSLVEAVGGGVTARTARRWMEAFDRQQAEHGGLRVIQ